MKTVHLSETLHKELKLAATKEGLNLNAFIARLLWKSIGGVHR